MFEDPVFEPQAVSSGDDSPEVFSTIGSGSAPPWDEDEEEEQDPNAEASVGLDESIDAVSGVGSPDFSDVRIDESLANPFGEDDASVIGMPSDDDGSSNGSLDDDDGDDGDPTPTL